MKTMVSSKDIWELVENGFQEPVDVIAYNSLTQEERDLLRKSLNYIYQAVHESIFQRIVVATKPKKAWDTLYKTYQGMEKG